MTQVAPRRILKVSLAVIVMLVTACGEPEPPEYLGDGSLGIVEVAQGQDVQIRSIYTSPGEIGLLGNSAEKAIVLALEDYGTIHGFDVNSDMTP